MPKDQIEFHAYIGPDGSYYDLHNLQSRFLMSIEGMGMPEIDYIEQRGPFQHGNTLLDYRLRPRTIQALFHYETANRGAYWRARNSLVNALRPNRQFQGPFNAGRLRTVYMDENQDMVYRDINVLIERGPEFSARELDSWQEWSFTESIRFIAPDPTFYDPEQVCGAFTMNLTSRLVFPETWPLIFGYGMVDNDLSLTYTGTWLAYPSFVITGPCSGPIITNTSTNQKIHIAYTISADETVHISLPYGKKSVINNNGKNLIGTVTDDSDLANFALFPEPYVAGGVNVLNFSASGCDANTAVDIGYYTRYIGI